MVIGQIGIAKQGFSGVCRPTFRQAAIRQIDSQLRKRAQAGYPNRSVESRFNLVERRRWATSLSTAIDSTAIDSTAIDSTAIDTVRERDLWQKGITATATATATVDRGTIGLGVAVVGAIA